MVITSPATIFSFWIASIIFVPKSYTVSISVVFKVTFPILAPLSKNIKFFLDDIFLKEITC